MNDLRELAERWQDYGALALEKMEAIDGDDTEHNHQVADDILCDLLTNLGFTEVVKSYREILKWYA